MPSNSHSPVHSCRPAAVNLYFQDNRITSTSAIASKLQPAFKLHQLSSVRRSNMSSSIVLSQAVIPVDSLLTCQKPGISKLPLQQSVCTQTKCHAGLHEPLNLQNDRKRRRVSLSGQSDRKRHRCEILAHERTIECLEHQVSCLTKLLQQAYAPQRKTSTKHNCPASSCGKPFTTLEHLCRHIREQKGSTHEPLAVLINETHCSVCSKTCSRPSDLVKHERKFHRQTYVSRLDKFFGTWVPLSPLSSDSIAVNGPSSR